MRFLTISSLLAAAVAAKDALVIVPNSNSASSSVSPTTARHIFAQRLGLGSLDAIKDVNQETINLLNAYGGHSQQLFGQDERRPSLLVMVEGVQDPKAQDILPSSASLPSFTISNPPSAANNLELLKYFSKQKTAGPETEMRDVVTVENLVKPMAGGVEMFQPKQNKFLISVDMEASTTEKVNTFIASTLEQLNEWDITIALMPSTSSSVFSKRAAQSTWFSDLPASGRPDLAPASNHDTNVANPPHSPSFPEDIYVSHPSQSSTSDPAHKSSWLDSLYPFNSEEESATVDSVPAWKAPATEITRILASSSNSSNTTTAPRGILPQCFSSQSQCESTTHNCAGHGSCSLKYKDSQGQGKGNCYSCQCSVSRHTNKDGTVKTTRWTGPACQKKDVSFEFWLLGSVTVGLLSVIAWGIGLLMHMGGQELPSVIGAGVAGVSRKN